MISDHWHAQARWPLATVDRLAAWRSRTWDSHRVRLLAELPGKNCWTIAEHAGERDPHGMQHFLARASWDANGVREDAPP
jgi:hypothetical protein